MNDLQELFKLFVQLGAQGQTAFIAWLALKGFIALVCGGTVITVVALIVGSVRRYSTNEATVREIGEIVGERCWEPSRSDQLRILNAVRELKAKP